MAQWPPLRTLVSAAHTDKIILIFWELKS